MFACEIEKESIVLVGFFNLTQIESLIKREGISFEKLPPSEWLVGMIVGAFSRLTINVGGPSSLWEVSSLDK